MKVGIVGSRKFTNWVVIKESILSLKEEYGDNLEIVSGGQAKGANGIAKSCAIEFKIKYIEFPPAHYMHNEYCIRGRENYGKSYSVSNYFDRNTEIAEYSDMILCFIPQGMRITESRGTFDTYTKALRLGKKVLVIN